MHAKITTYYVTETPVRTLLPGVYRLRVRNRLLRRFVDWLAARRWSPLQSDFDETVEVKCIKLDLESVHELIREQYEMLLARGEKPTTVLLGHEAMHQLSIETNRQLMFDLPGQYYGLRLILVPHVDGVVVF